ncbi:MAG: GntR family transcriptional regulator [Trebonia sp.]
MTARRERVTCGVRAAILRGDYADGQHLSQDKLAAQYGVGCSVVWHALIALQDEGYVSPDARRRFHANASYLTRQLQLVLNKVEGVERLACRAVVALGEDPLTFGRQAHARAARRQAPARARLSVVRE